MTQGTLDPAHATTHDPVREIERISEQNIWACYQCGKCTADCPFSLTPNLAVRLLQLGQVEAARSLATTWECASCYTCQTGCPKGVSPARVMKALRAMENGHRPGDLLHPSDLMNQDPDSFARTRAVKKRWAPRELLAARILRIRARALASMPRMFGMMSRFASVSNGLVKVPGARLFAHVALGVHKDRRMPAFASVSFPTWFAQHRPASDGHRGSVLLFHDEFMDFNYPATGIAVTEVLEKAGYTVELFRGACCGRPMISKGLTEGAKACAVNNVPLLHKAVEAGAWIVGTEPSCLLTLRDEYLHLVPTGQEEMAKAVAQRTFLIDEFLMMLHEKGELELKFRDLSQARPVLFHGHCHQKAFASAAKSVDLLCLAGYDAELINAACCGMAGLYGFEKQHFQASHAAAERGVLPAIRERPDADLVIMGVSCRQQIEQFAGRPVRHLVEAFRDAIA